MDKVKKAKLTEGNIGTTLLRQSSQMIMGVLGMVAFNLVDTFFAGMLGVHELAALSFTFPVAIALGSLAMGIGTGSGALISRAIGKGDHDSVVRLTTDSLILSVIAVAVFATTGVLTIDPLFSFLGANEAVAPLIHGYMTIWYCGVAFLIVPMVGNAAIRATGDTKTPSIIMLIAAAINIGLDPILIFGLGPFPRLELEGAAYATVIARAVALFIGIYVLHYQKRMISFELVMASEFIDSCKKILYIALPAAASRIVSPVAIGILTMIIASYGPKAVAAFGVATRLEFISMVAVFALSVVIGPFVGQNIGAKKYDRVRQAVRLSIRFALCWGLFILVLMMVLAQPLASIFTTDGDVIAYATLYLSIAPLGYGLFGIVQIATATLNVLNKPLYSVFIMALMMFGICVPLAWLGSATLGLVGVIYGITAAFIIAGLVSHLALKRSVP